MRIAMDATANLKATLETRHGTEARAGSNPAITNPESPRGQLQPVTRHIAGFEEAERAEIFKNSFGLADVRPCGRYLAKEMCESSGVPGLMRTLLGHGDHHGDCLTVTGRTVADTLERVEWNKDQCVVHPDVRPLSATGGGVGLKGNLAPLGALAVGMADLEFTGPARGFDGEGARFAAVKNKNDREGEVLVIRDAGPHGGGPGMREMPAAPAALHPEGMDAEVAPITDRCFSEVTALLAGAGVGPPPLVGRLVVRGRDHGARVRGVLFTPGPWKCALQAPVNGTATDAGAAVEKVGHAPL
jgi:dihydroxy-acid dehydratase